MQDRPFQLFNTAVAPNEHTGGQVVPVWCPLPVFAVTDAALPVRGFPMENAVAMQDLFPAKSGWHRQGVGGGPYLFSEYAERRRNKLEFLLIRLRP
jgi:hypothetical protein